MKLVSFYALLSILYLFTCNVLCSGDGPINSKKINVDDDEMKEKEKAMRKIFEDDLLIQIISPLVSIILGYNTKIVWKTKRVDPNQVKDKEFKCFNDTDFMQVDDLMVHSKPLARNGRKLFYNRESNNLIIEETVACPSNPTGIKREKPFKFVADEVEYIQVYLGNRYLVVAGCFWDRDNDNYKSIDIYDLDDPAFWNTEFKANSDVKTALTGNEDYGTHIEPDLYSRYRIGFWRDEEEEYVIIAIRQADATGYEKLIDKELQENRKDPENDNLVIGGNEHVIILDLESIKDIPMISYTLLTNDGQIMKIQEGEKKGNELLDIYYKIYQE